MKIIQVQDLSITELQRLVSLAVKEALDLNADALFSKKSFTKKEFAALIGKSQSFIDSERRKGNLKWKKNGGTVSIPATESEKYI